MVFRGQRVGRHKTRHPSDIEGCRIAETSFGGPSELLNDLLNFGLWPVSCKGWLGWSAPSFGRALAAAGGAGLLPRCRRQFVSQGPEDPLAVVGPFL